MGRSAHEKRTARTSSPLEEKAFSDQLDRLIGPERDALGAALDLDTPVSIRLNNAKWNGPTADPVPWCTSGRYLKERPAFTFDPFLHAGCYYVQEASSMLLEQAFRATGFSDREILALDFCAAPGGKSTHLRNLITPGSMLVANEVDPKRRSVLQENLWKWGSPNTVITGSASSDLEHLPGSFDLILVDAPCSGEGMFRKDPFARAQWSTALVQQCAATQRVILDHIWKSLRPGGCLIYSTCTWNEAENEDQLSRLLPDAECLTMELSPEWGILETEQQGIVGYRCFPHRLRGEGLFMAVLRKKGDTERSGTKVHDTAYESVENNPLEWLATDRISRLIERDGSFFAVSAEWVGVLEHIMGVMKVAVPGLPVADPKGHELQPHPALALSGVLAKGAFPEIPLNSDEAFRYLRGEALIARHVSGTALATYEGLALGWLQGAGNRWNNRWPTPWRIRAHKPNAPPVSWAR